MKKMSSAQRPPPSDSSAGSKPKMKPKTRRSITAEKPLAVGPPKVSATQAQPPEELLDEAELEQALNIRVKERDPDDPPGGRNRSNRRLGQLFRDPSPSAAAIKETIKRPLSGLFRRPGSKSGSRPSSRSGGRRGDDDDEPSSTANGHVIIDDSELEQLAKTSTTAGSSSRRGALKGEKTRGGGGDDSTETMAMDVATVSPLRRNGTSTPDIPQLEDTFATGFGFGDNVAHAPTIAVNRVASFRELDSALMKHAAFSTLEDIDLSLLTRFLCPESEVKDEEVPWTWDYLYTSICTELREEWAMDEGEEDEQYDAQAQAVQDDQRKRGIAA